MGRLKQENGLHNSTRGDKTDRGRTIPRTSKRTALARNRRRKGFQCHFLCRFRLRWSRRGEAQFEERPIEGRLRYCRRGWGNLGEFDQRPELYREAFQEEIDSRVAPLNVRMLVAPLCD